MKGNWKNCLLGDVITLQRGFDLPERERAEGNVPIVSSSGATGYHNTAMVKAPGVVTGRYGTLGEVHYVSKDFWPLNTTLYVKEFNGNCPLFISHFLRTLNLSSQNSAGAVPGVNRNHLHMLKVKIPTVSIQCKIAGVLSAYDDLIENNTRRIAILEEMAQAIYREWFVNFRFPGHENLKLINSPLGKIPEGWKVVNLFDVSEVAYGFPYKSKQFSTEPVGKPVIRIRDILGHKSDTFTAENAGDKYIVTNGDILIGMDGDFHMCRWAGGEAVLNQRVTRIRTNGQLPQYVVFHALKGPISHFNTTIVGTTVAHLGDKHLREINVLLPSAHIRTELQSLFEPLFIEEINFRKKNELLRTTRDLLLPKLISGELDVEELDIETGEPLVEAVA